MCIHLGSFPFHLMRCAALSSSFVFAESLLTISAYQAIQENARLTPVFWIGQVKAGTVHALVASINEAIAELKPWPLPGEPMDDGQ